MKDYIIEDLQEEFDQVLSDEDLIEIQEEYRRRRLIESLIGPFISTIFHVILIIVLAIFIVERKKKKVFTWSKINFIN